MNTVFIKPTAALGLVLALLAGCSNDALVTSRDAINANNALLSSAAARAQNRAPQTGRVSSSPDIYLGEEVIELGGGNPLPEGLGSVDLVLREAVPLSYVARALSEQVNYPIISLMTAPLNPVGRLQGDLGTVLQSLKTSQGIGYDHRGGVIMLVPAGVEIVPIPTPLMPALQAASTRSGSSRSGGGQSTGQGASGTGKSIATEEGLKDWLKKLEELNPSLPYPGAQIKVHAELGVISIRGPAAAIPRIKSLVQDRLAQLRTQSRIVVRVLAVDLGNSRSLQTNLDSVWGSLFGQPARLIGTSTATAFSLLRNTPTGIKADTLESTISTIARRNTLVTNERIDATLMPGSVKRISEVRNITYIRSSTPAGQTSGSTISSTTATINQEELTVGTQGSIVAMPSSRSRITVGYSLTISQLLDLKTLVSGNVTVQQPDTFDRELNDQIDIASGDTLVLSSRVVQTARNNSAGAVTADIPLPGSTAGETSYQLQLVLLSAELLSPTAPNRDPSTGNILQVAGDTP
jgi:hypothetical protein